MARDPAFQELRKLDHAARRLARFRSTLRRVKLVPVVVVFAGSLLVGFGTGFLAILGGALLLIGGIEVIRTWRARRAQS